MAIEVKNLFYIYGRKTPYQQTALDDVSFTIPTGSFVGLIGRTGSGKSTLVQNLNALLIPTKGEIIVIA